RSLRRLGLRRLHRSGAGRDAVIAAIVGTGVGSGRWRRVGRGPAPAVHLTPAGDVAQVLLVRLGEGVPARAVGDEEEVAGTGRIGDRFERGATGIGDRTGRQAVDDIGVVGR